MMLYVSMINFEELAKNFVQASTHLVGSYAVNSGYVMNVRHHSEFCTTPKYMHIMFRHFMHHDFLEIQVRERM